MSGWSFDNLLAYLPIWAVALVSVVLATVFWAIGEWAADRIRPRLPTHSAAAEKMRDQEGFMVGSVLGLLALLLGFTFALAVDRFDARRALVLEEADTIGTAYLRAQLLPEPHRAQMSRLLVAYTDNRLVLATARPGRNAELLAANDRLVADIWRATAAAFPAVQHLDFSSTWLDTMNRLIDLDMDRKAARLARVPGGVFLILYIYFAATAGLMGYVMGPTLRPAGGALLGLFALALLLVVDIDQPTAGLVNESQTPMRLLRNNMSSAHIAPPRPDL
ncbi:hypothetical protein [Phenylobacterium sp. J367]|uniref:bestrophin-like domain n=1 Tax=Phenylobacterium sp. J367 TaxID=2898435 RepID=UPI002151E33A|nr:hypothetical protein [Phenylobacterium sp. J367]MCR5877245.1 hypothetical protein [Phenylobacterium sp. J367]